LLPGPLWQNVFLFALPLAITAILPQFKKRQ